MRADGQRRSRRDGGAHRPSLSPARAARCRPHGRRRAVDRAQSVLLSAPLQKAGRRDAAGLPEARSGRAREERHPACAVGHPRHLRRGLLVEQPLLRARRARARNVAEERPRRRHRPACSLRTASLLSGSAAGRVDGAGGLRRALRRDGERDHLRHPLPLRERDARARGSTPASRAPRSRSASGRSYAASRSAKLEPTPRSPARWGRRTRRAPSRVRAPRTTWRSWSPAIA